MFEDIKDATPLSEEDKQKLIPFLNTQKELNEFEARNILSAMEWAHKNRSIRADLISVTGMLKLHEKMFDETWERAFF